MITSKEFIVDSYFEDMYFFAYMFGEEVHSVEIMPDNYPHISICYWNNIQEFVENTMWHDWIKVGIKNDKINELVNEK